MREREGGREQRTTGKREIPGVPLSISRNTESSGAIGVKAHSTGNRLSRLSLSPRRRDGEIKCPDCFFVRCPTFASRLLGVYKLRVKSFVSHAQPPARSPACCCVDQTRRKIRREATNALDLRARTIARDLHDHKSPFLSAAGRPAGRDPGEIRPKFIRVFLLDGAAAFCFLA